MMYAMHMTEPSCPVDGYLPAPSPGARDPRQELERRLKMIVHVHGFSPRLNGVREANFQRIVRNARHAMERGDAKAILAAHLALDLLSLELCED